MSFTTTTITDETVDNPTVGMNEKLVVTMGGKVVHALVDYGVLSISSGGTAVSTTVINGSEYVINGGSAIDTTLDGQEIISPDSTSTGTIVNRGGSEEIQFSSAEDATVSETTLNPGGNIILDGMTFNTATLHATINYDTDVLTVTDGSAAYTQTLSGDYSGEFFHVAPPFTIAATNFVTITVDSTPCYCRGTLILTDHGEVPIEQLAAGDRVITLAGVAEPILWIGRRRYGEPALASNPAAQPIMILAGALGAGLPRRTLRVSPLHAMFLDGALVPSGDLVNGMTILRERHCRQVEYFHIELAAHEVILAEGAPSETFVDDESRTMFDNAAEHPSGPRHAAAFCAPRLTEGHALDAIRQRLAKMIGPDLAAA